MLISPNKTHQTVAAFRDGEEWRRQMLEYVAVPRSVLSDAMKRLHDVMKQLQYRKLIVP